jgi:hypothetical protein
MFTVNGSIGVRVPGSAAYKIRHANKTTGYASDGNISQLYYLTANDYVRAEFYLPNGTIRYYRYAMHFAGFLVA